MLTYLPFEKLGYEYLNDELLKENSNVIQFKYNKIMELLDDEDRKNFHRLLGILEG